MVQTRCFGACDRWVSLRSTHPTLAEIMKFSELVYQAKSAMAEHIAVLSATNRPVPPRTNNPTILIQNAHNLEQAA